PRHWDWLRNWRIWDHFCDYFPITVIRECPLPPGRSYILPAHPHGISCIGIFGAFVTGARGAAGRDPRPRRDPKSDPRPRLQPCLAALEGLFRLPIYREYALAAGLCPVSRRCLDAVLARGSRALLIVVGGAAEALEGTPGCHRVTLRRRRGFVRLALRHGETLLNSGELLLDFGDPSAFPAVGTPLEVPRVPRPPPEVVAHFHALYVRRLRELFERHKVACGVPPETPLLIV
uniref:2-acylglycerol O-acyltransferase 3-like n=1 Tax=Lonchura striata TaxID=40157 RepID=UPI00129322C5